MADRTLTALQRRRIGQIAAAQSQMKQAETVNAAQRRKAIAAAIKAGVLVSDIVRVLPGMLEGGVDGLSEQRLYQIRNELIADGSLPSDLRDETRMRPVTGRRA